jgi:leader peptidase (prepilin peptidase)/N-methyltransferase
MPDFFGDGPPIPAGAGFMIDLLCLALLCLASVMTAWTDLRGGVIPDWLNLTILLLGLLWSFARDGWVAVFEAACAAVAVGATVWLLRRLYFAIRKIQGLGLGDVKFLAAAAAWLGIAGIPVMLLAATLTALATAGVLRIAGQSMTRQTSLPFGPFLAIGLWAGLMLRQSGYLAM